MSQANPGPGGDGPKPVQRSEPRPPLGLDELLEILQRQEFLTEPQTKEIEARATTLRSRVLKDRVGSVRSQAASRYEVTPVELVAAMAFAHPTRPHGKLDEDALAELLAVESGIPYLKIDPLRIDNDLVTKTLSRPFARHHVVIPVAR
ncbi:MAG: type II/IV secretion system protein, partial [Deltaproteobacteria bacterium]|nr:type II/IV secretion system protein [Deltaproteobacteria bacterium]